MGALHFSLLFRLFGQRVTKLAVQFTSAMQLKIFQGFSEQHILFVTMGQRKLLVTLSLLLLLLLVLLNILELAWYQMEQ